jgi:hypothetical protein
VWDHSMAPLHGSDSGPFYLVFRPKELSAAIGYTTVMSVGFGPISFGTKYHLLGHFYSSHADTSKVS